MWRMRDTGPSWLEAGTTHSERASWRMRAGCRQLTDSSLYMKFLQKWGTVNEITTGHTFREWIRYVLLIFVSFSSLLEVYLSSKMSPVSPHSSNVPYFSFSFFSFSFFLFFFSAIFEFSSSSSSSSFLFSPSSSSSCSTSFHLLCVFLLSLFIHHYGVCYEYDRHLIMHILCLWIC